jgi:hypothetical protein
MRIRLMTVSTAAIAIAGAITLGAQTPQQPQNPQQTQPQTQPPMDRQRPATDVQRPATDTQRPATDAQRMADDISSQTITITGCVKPESDVPGRRPNVVERTGVTEDYILTNVKMSSTSNVSGIGLSTMYEIEGIAGAELKKHINHQVELTGRVAANRQVNDDSPDFQATSMKMVSATCPAEK